MEVIANMRRDTQITIYKTGRIDPTYNNIWAFESETQRNLWFTRKEQMPFLNCKYWRLGAPLRLPISYEDSFGYDYVVIRNNQNGKAFTYYAFVTSRAYISNNCTMFTLELDIVQTYYFSTAADGGTYPFWQVEGFVTRDLSDDLPPRGTTSELPTGVPVAVTGQFEATDYKLAIFSTINLSKLPSIEYISGTVGNSYTAAPPYIIDLNAEAINNVIAKVNDAGVTDAIVGMYLVPAVFFARDFATPTLLPTINAYHVFVDQPQKCDGYTPKNKILLGYDYSYFIINNNQGETMLYHFEDFDGTPEFYIDMSLTAGSPTIFCTPLNYIGDITERYQRTIKITQAPSATWLNDNYKIWLAQTRNSRAASINAAQLAIDQAYEAKRQSFTANVDGIVDGLTRGIDNIVSSDKRANAAKVSQETTNFVLNGGLLGATGRALKYAGNKTLDVLSGVANTIAGTNFATNRAANPRSIISGDDTATAVSEATGLTSANYTQFLHAAVNKMLGIEQAYIYDQRAATAIASYNQVIASIRDHSAVPATAVGSNAYGDITFWPQYGFTFITYTPSKVMAEMLDTALSGSGHIVNKYKAISKYHSVFDVVSAKSVYIPVEIDKRPEYARRLLMELLSKGVYLWYVYNGDISDHIGATYKLDNPEVV